ncbi:hypothetical protein ACROYT_G015099 [Oculina patagonica]
MASYFGCGFARVAAKLSYLKPNGKVEYDQEQRCRQYSGIFKGEHKKRFEVDQYSFNKRSKSIVLHFKKWKTAEREKYIEHFSPNNWEKLTEHEKRQHCRSQCKACDVHHFSIQSLFPLWGNKSKSVTNQSIYKKVNSRVLKESSAVNVKVTKKAIKAATKEVYDKINTPFEKTFGITFAVAQTSVPELNVQVKKSHAELKRERRNKSRADKKHIQKQWATMDCDTMLGTRQTYSQRQQQRLLLSFETKLDAENRANKRARLEEEGQRKKKRHSPKPDHLNFDKDGLLEEVNTMKDGEMSKIESGEYILGEMIVPQTVKKVTLTKEGKIKKETFTVTGRKIPLLDIRKNMLKEHEEMGLMRIRSDSDYDFMTEDEISSRLKQLGEDEEEESASNRKEKLKEIERKRHLMVCSDNATLLNHGHILLTVNAVYDEALYFTNEEMKGMGQENVDVDAGCASCSGDSRKYKHLAVSLNRPHLSLQERKKKVLQGPAGRQKRNGGIKPFKDLLLEELKRECSARGLPCDGQKDELQEVLKEELVGFNECL